MERRRPPSLVAVSAPLAIAAVVAACSGGKKPDAGGGAGEGEPRTHGLTKQQAAEVLVKVGDTTITVGEFAERLAEQSPYLRARYASPERRREFLDNLVRFELMAAEAHRRGYDRSEEVERTRKQMMIQALMKAEFEDRIQPSDITDDEVRAYYESHRDEFDKPEQVRASHILIRDRAKAQRVLREVLAKKTDIAFWRTAAQTHNEDPETRDRFGDLRFFSRPAERRPDEPDIPAAVAEAAFGLAQIGDIHEQLVQSPAGYHIVKLTGRRAALRRSLEEASRPIRNRLWRERREQKIQEFIDQLRARANVQIDEAALAAVRIDVPEGTPAEPRAPQQGGSPAQGAARPAPAVGAAGAAGR
jgi:peptidyl-prolyl cis-trans isomerase C